MKKLLILPLVIFTSPTFANSLTAEEMAIIQDQECQTQRKGGRYVECDDKTIQHRNDVLYSAITELKKIPTKDAKYEMGFYNRCGEGEIGAEGSDWRMLRTQILTPAQKGLLKKAMDEMLSNCPTYPTISNYDELIKLPMLSFSYILTKNEQYGNSQAFKEIIGVLKEEYGARINDNTMWADDISSYVRCSSVKNNLENIYQEIDERYGKRAQNLAEQEKKKVNKDFLQYCSDILKLTPKSYLKKHFE
ncbi:hypothetical protein [Mannheimia pernigra]|uniref:hypothetical protein n=1 Tax=Mannheimia pernigra TaxID=111844 RepID=UPI00159F4EF9|nr:hypothetical protein [Mannheimia pernigra]QLB44765.1 hypothetical protein HV561_08430 [Mannheimia pernigra]